MACIHDIPRLPEYKEASNNDSWFGNLVRVHELTLLPNHTQPSLVLSTVEGGSGFVPPCVVSGW